jgi:hypothetical protein
MSFLSTKRNFEELLICIQASSSEERALLQELSDHESQDIAKTHEQNCGFLSLCKPITVDNSSTPFMALSDNECVKGILHMLMKTDLELLGNHSNLNLHLILQYCDAIEIRRFNKEHEKCMEQFEPRTFWRNIDDIQVIASIKEAQSVHFDSMFSPLTDDEFCTNDLDVFETNSRFVIAYQVLIPIDETCPEALFMTEDCAHKLLPRYVIEYKLSSSGA